MTVIITLFIILASVVLAFFVLVQNPKGGGLTGNFGSLGTQVMGVQQSTDVMEKGTWVSMGAIALICILSVAFMPKPDTRDVKLNQPAPKSAPASNKK